MTMINTCDHKTQTKKGAHTVRPEEPRQSGLVVRSHLGVYVKPNRQPVLTNLPMFSR